MQRQRLDEMFPHVCMTQKARIQFECVMERDSSFQLWKDREREEKKRQRGIHLRHFSLSLYGSVNAFCCCLCLLCSARVDQCLLPHCLWRPSLVMRSYRLCLKCPHILSYTNIGKPTHTHTVQTEKSVQGRPQKQTHKQCLHLSLSLSLASVPHTFASLLLFQGLRPFKSFSIPRLFRPSLPSYLPRDRNTWSKPGSS